MGMDARRYLKARRDRAIGAVLGGLESDLQGKVTRSEWEGIRALVLDAVNGYHDSVLDLMKSEDDTSTRNAAVIDTLVRIERLLTRPTVH